MRETPVAEVLLLLTSLTVVPAILVVLYALVTGRLTADEDRRFLPILERDVDWWASETDADGDRREGDG